MKDRDLYKVYFCIKLNEISIYVKSNDNSDIVFFKKKKIIKNSYSLYMNDIQQFFDEKIEEIENKTKIFIENIVLILEDEKIFTIQLYLKQKIENRNIHDEEIKNLLSIGLQQIYKHNLNQQILHYVIESFNVDGQMCDSVENKIIKKFFSMDLKFVCIEQKLIENFKNLFKKKQIFLKKVISNNYLNEFMNEKDDIINLASKIEKGYNKLEIQLIPKKPAKRGFFENFFLSF